MSKLPISVCIVSGAEAHRIGKALESVVDWVSEIVVVLDDRAQDGTERVVERFGGRVCREPWKGFIGQKNSAAEKCGQPWLLNLDADEVVSAPLREEIESLFRESERLNAHAAYRFPRCTFYCGRWIRHGDWYPDRVLRLWRKDSGRWAGEEPHAHLQINGRIGTLKSDLLHESNESIAQHVAKIVPYQQGFVEAWLARGRSVGAFELCIRPPWRFLRGYILRLGFLDGWPGLYIAGLNAFSTLTRYALIKQAQLKKTAGK